jgi:hypothetical protein
MKMYPNSAAYLFVAVIATFGWFDFSPRAAADVILFEDRGWRVDGVEDVPLAAHTINVSVAKKSKGAFHELKVYYSPETNAQPQVCSFTADRIRPQLPGGPAGGAFALSSYWECTGYVPPLEIQTLNIRTRRKKGTFQLELTGTASNLTSLVASKLSFLIDTPTTDGVAIAVDYRLRATRDICLNDTNQKLGFGFNTANIISSYTSAATNVSDTVRYNALVDKHCIPISFGQKCVKHTVLHCYSLTNTDVQQVISETYRMNSTKLWLLHTAPAPDNTPSLAIEFLHPAPGYQKPQAMTLFNPEPDTENVFVWGSWRQAKGSYKARKNLGRFKYNLLTLPPVPMSCTS